MLGWTDTRPLKTLLPVKEAAAIKKTLGFTTAEELLWYFPRTYVPHGGDLSIGMITEGEYATIIGTVAAVDAKYSSTGILITTVRVFDGTSTIPAVFFRTPWVQRTLHPGSRVLLSGKVSVFNNTISLSHPDYSLLQQGTEEDDTLAMLQSLPVIPIYRAKKSMPSWRILRAILTVLEATPPIPDPLGDNAPGDLPSFDEALRGVHMEGKEYLDRFAYQEALTLCLAMALRRHQATTQKSIPLLPVAGRAADQLSAGLPYALTQGQQQVLATLGEGLATDQPMQHLLQGEVGSGKTVVALLAMLRAVDNGTQCAFLAPTEVLVHQHARGLKALLTGAGVKVRLEEITGSMGAKEKQQILLDTITGEVDILVGTHALIQENVEFFRLGLCVVDEQHRFGVEQRSALRTKGLGETVPHMLVMTATPIPRTIALTAFGDLRLSELRELPGGRQPISSAVVSEDGSPSTAGFLRFIGQQVEKGHQGYIVCPRIEGDGGVLERYESLSTGLFQNFRVGLLHGGLDATTKDDTMRAFAAGDIDVLVATTVIEVGVDVPNATTMLVLESERFGIAQLHQLRGRVGRGGNKSWCAFHTLAEPGTPSYQRVSDVAATTDGFALAEIDLAYRSEGDVAGTIQAGVGARRGLLSYLEHKDLIERARADADQLVAHSPKRARWLIRELAPEAADNLEKA